MARLNISNKMHILRGLLDHANKDRALAISALGVEVAHAVYEDLYDKKIREKMAFLPDGWLPKVNKIQVALGADHHYLYFGVQAVETRLPGSINHASRHSYGLVNDDSRSLVVLDKDKSKVRLLEVRSPLGIRVQDWADQKSSFKEETREMARLAWRTLNSFTTVNALIKGWPEIEPFARRFNVPDPVASRLPVPILEPLNRQFRLPVEEMRAT